jgi:hypothetical protein
LTIVGFIELRTHNTAVMKTLSILELIGGILLAGGLGFLGWQLSTRKAVDIFTGQETQAAPPQTVECPTCHQMLDVVSEKCPNCDRPLEEMPAIVRAVMIDMQNGREFPILLRKLTRIGRDNPGFEVQFDDPTVGSNHALIEFTDGAFYLHAQVDVNGTFVNDVKVRDCILQTNDILRFGRAQAKFMTFSEEFH